MAFEYCEEEVSGRWVSACPTSIEMELQNLQFSEVAAAYLGTGSPAAIERIGQPVAGKKHGGARWREPWKVDRHGNVIHSLSLEGNYASRHDAFKDEMERLMRWAGYKCSTEVYGLFAGLIEQGPHAAEMATAKKRQGLVPDFAVGEMGLAELKFIGANPSHYPATRAASRGGEYVSPVVRKAELTDGGLQAVYEKKLRKVDGPEGKVLARLKDYGHIRGWVVGAHGEMSDDLLGHIKVMAEAKLGAPLKTAPGEASVAMEFLRRRMGLAAVKAQANYLLDGLRWAGPSGEDAYRRRKERRVEDDLLRRAEEAQYFARYHKDHAHQGPRPGEGGPGGH